MPVSMAHSRASSALKSLTRLSSPMLSFSLAQTSHSVSSSRSRSESRSSGRSKISVHLWLIDGLAEGESDIAIAIGGLTDPSTGGLRRRPLRYVRTARAHEHRVERLAGRHVQAVALGTAKAEVGADLRQQY